ncbi:MAG: SIMPL domain-containing protein [Proteobacteria bacterium]|nr:SIMPL domain-containing protein [Pseudomonadota bacterium]
MKSCRHKSLRYFYLILLPLLFAQSLAFGSQLSVKSPARVISVSGSAEKQVSPNLAYISFTVEHRDRALDAARRQVNTATNAVLATLRTLRIAEADINAGSILVLPTYNYDRSGVRQFEGYTVTRPIRITLRDLSLLGSLIERSMNAGVNQISEPIFDHSDRKSLERSVLGAATQAARENAVAAAAGIDMQPGDAIRVSVASPPVMPRASTLRIASMDAAANEHTYQPGSLVLRVNVEAEFELIPRVR